jgi:hypothetical protein
VATRFVSSSSTPSVTPSNILSDFIIPLTNDKWTLWSKDQFFTNLTARVPGDLLSDLMMNGLIDDPYIDRNFLTQEKVWNGNDQNVRDKSFTVGDDEKVKENNFAPKRTWIYSTTFDVPENASIGISWKLVLEGIKMGADVLINDQKIGQVIDQFLRYEFKIGNDVLYKGALIGENVRRHNLTISFDPLICVNGRFTGE